MLARRACHAARQAGCGSWHNTNLLDPENGAQIVAAGEEAWRGILETQQPKCAYLSKQSFVIVGLGKEQPTPIATLAVHVDTQGTHNLKQLALFAADDERGPLKKSANSRSQTTKICAHRFTSLSLNP